MLSIKTLPTLPPQGRIIFVGDIHGCLDEFNHLLQEARYNPHNDQLVLVGDLVNKGYDSVGVVKRAMELGAHCVLGNHDAALIARCDHIREGEIDPHAAPHNADPVTATAANLPRDCYKFLVNLPHVISVPQFDVVVVHAGVNPKLPIDGQNLWELLHMRRVLPNGRVTDAQNGGELWATKWRGPQTIIFGHDARTGLQKHQFAIGLDSGCCYGGDLTAYVLPQKQYIRVNGSKRGVAKKPVTASPATAIGYSPSTEMAVTGRSPATGTGATTSPSSAQSLTATLRGLLGVGQPAAVAATLNAKDTHHGVPTAVQFPSAPTDLVDPAIASISNWESAGHQPAATGGLPQPRTAATPATQSPQPSHGGIPAPRSKVANTTSASPPLSGPASGSTTQPPSAAGPTGVTKSVAVDNHVAAALPAAAQVATKPPRRSPRTSPQHGPAASAHAGGKNPLADDLLRHIVESATDMLETTGQPLTRAWGLRLLRGDAVDGVREDLIETGSVAAAVWARLVKALVAHASAAACPAREAEEALGWVQDIVTLNDEVSKLIDHKALSETVGNSKAAPKSAIRSTQIALRQ